MHKRRLRYKGIPVNIFGIPTFDKPHKRERPRKKIYLHSFNSDKPLNSPKNLLVIYDIPHDRKKERDWFRRQLKNFGFVMIQKSAWMGPSPLPENFLKYLKSVGLQKEFKTFKLAKPYAV